MAELRRVGGKMESSRVFGGHRALLPYEVQLCEALGITEEEYWQFIYLAESVNGKRRKEYDLIPNIVNMPAVPIAPLFFGGVSIGFYGVVAIGVALSYISNALRPKPKAPKTPPSLQTEGAQSVKRFSPQTGFNSLQELAVIGETIPLIFTKRDNDKNIGGIRVNSKLVWSQLKSLGTFQQLKAVFVLSNKGVETPPDFAGYAIGDLLLKNYTGAKLALYYKSKSGNNRIKETNIYTQSELAREIGRDGSNPEDVFSVDLDIYGQIRSSGFNEKVFCGVRTPTTQSRFGNFAPMPNMMRFQLPYELILKAKDASNPDDIDKKRRKIAKYYPRYAGFLKHNNEEKHGRFKLEKNNTVRYTIGDMNPVTRISGDFNPWGLEDVKTALDSDRERIDDNISIGETYLIGSAIAICTKVSTTELWRDRTYKDFDFKIVEEGPDNISEFELRGGNNTDGINGFDMAHSPWELDVLQKVSIASITNNRECNVTEIGLKSKVFKQITGFPNVNSHPGGFNYDEPSGTLKTYQDDNGNINLGPLNKYVTRYSFFRLQARKAGTDDNFVTIDNDKPFAIKGRTPQSQYNFIRINHPLDQYEFRFVPYPGNLIKRNFVDSNNKEIRILKASGALQQYSVIPDFLSTDLVISYSGFNIPLTGGDASNNEWYIGARGEQETSSAITSLADNSFGDIGVDSGESVNEVTKFDLADKSYVEYVPIHDIYIFYYEGEYIGGVTATDKNKAQVFQKGGGVSYAVGNFVNQEIIEFEEGPPGGILIEEYEIIKSVLLPNRVAVLETVEVNIQNENSNGNGAKVEISFLSTDGMIWRLTNGGSGYKSGDRVLIPEHSISVLGRNITFPGLITTVSVADQSFITDPWPDPAPADSEDGGPIGNAVNNRNILPYGAIADFISFEAEVPSHMEEPEHEIVYVNELVLQDNEISYTDLTVAGIRINSSKEFASFSQLSAYFQNGLSIKNLIDKTIGPSNLFPDIAYALLTDPLIGAGDLIGVRSVDEERMKIASEFCKANKLFWDGVIVDEKNLREFIFQNAQYCLLDFTILGGRFSLFPSVPFNASTFLIEPTQEPFIKALFTDGNTKNLQVSFLSAEERQDFNAFATYRHEKLNGFPETKVIGRRLISTTDNEPRENFDMSTFCTSATHAQIFLDYALKVRNKIDHGITFDTTPQAAMHLAPGDYIRLHSEATHNNRFANGVITQDGEIQSQVNLTNGTQIMFWKPGDTSVSKIVPIQIENSKAASTFRGSVFTVPDNSISDRVYKIESISYAEDGLINISGSHAPLNADGKLAVINYPDADIITLE